MLLVRVFFSLPFQLIQFLPTWYLLFFFFFFLHHYQTHSFEIKQEENTRTQWLGPRCLDPLWANASWQCPFHMPLFSPSNPSVQIEQHNPHFHLFQVEINIAEALWKLWQNQLFLQCHLHPTMVSFRGSNSTGTEHKHLEVNKHPHH